jgi:cytidyltransferase-like protein
MKRIIVSAPFDDIRSRHLRLLQEAQRLGEVTVLLWTDDLIERVTGAPPKFPETERRYFLEAVRYVEKVILAPDDLDPAQIPPDLARATNVWVDDGFQAARDGFCKARGIVYRVLSPGELAGFPAPPPQAPSPDRKKVIVTGCYDWFHSGHVRFCEEVSRYGDLYLVVGHDANIRLLKGEGHPLLPQEERRFVAGSIKYVTQALISSGNGWLDAEPEIAQLKPDIYAVNEDGDRGGKRGFCEAHGIEYLVLKREPAPGLPRRSSTDLRGF